MQTKSKSTTYERAVQEVAGFSSVFNTVRQQVAKNLLGHAKIETTMVYLHIAQCPLVQAHSPLDTLYPKSQWQKSAQSTK